MSRISRVIILPFAGAEAESNPGNAMMCRGLASFVDEHLARLPHVETALQHLVISPDDDSNSYRWLIVASKWTLEQVLELPIPDTLEASHLLQGSVVWQPDAWEVDLQLVDLEARESVWEGRLSCHPDEFIAQWMSLLADMAVDALGETRSAANRVFAPPTKSPAALENYLTAVAQVSARRLRMPGVTIEQCLGHFLDAIRADGNYLDACRKLNGLAMHALFEEETPEGREAALAAIREGRQLAPGFPLFGATLGMWHASRGDDDAGTRLLEEYVGTERDGEPLSRGLAVLGTIYRRQGRRTDAIRALTAAVEKDASNLAGWEELALVHMEAGEHESAEACLRRVLEDDPERPGALLHLGGIYWQREDYARAHRIFEKALDAAPESGEAKAHFVAASLMVGRTERANQVVTEWAEQHPEEPEPWLFLARIRRGMGDADGVAFCLRHLRSLAGSDSIAAAIQLEELAETHPEDHAEFLGLGGGAEGSPQPAAMSPREREDRLRELAARHPDSLPIWMALSGHLVAMEQWSEAASAQARVVLLYPGSASQWNTLGVLRSRAVGPREALLAFETAARLSPEVASIHTNLGLCLLELGEPERARQELTRALALGEKSPVAALALLRIKALGPTPATPPGPAPSDAALQRLAALLDQVRRRMEG